MTHFALLCALFLSVKPNSCIKVESFETCSNMQIPQGDGYGIDIKTNNNKGNNTVLYFFESEYSKAWKYYLNQIS